MSLLVFFFPPPGGLLPALSCKHVFYFSSPARSHVLASRDCARTFLPMFTRMQGRWSPGSGSRLPGSCAGCVRLTRQAGFYTLLSVLPPSLRARWRAGRARSLCSEKKALTSREDGAVSRRVRRPRWLLLRSHGFMGGVDVLGVGAGCCLLAGPAEDSVMSRDVSVPMSTVDSKDVQSCFPKIVGVEAFV